MTFSPNSTTLKGVEQRDGHLWAEMKKTVGVSREGDVSYQYS